MLECVISWMHYLPADTMISSLRGGSGVMQAGRHMSKHRFWGCWGGRREETLHGHTRQHSPKRQTFSPMLFQRSMLDMQQNVELQICSHEYDFFERAKSSLLNFSLVRGTNLSHGPLLASTVGMNNIYCQYQCSIDLRSVEQPCT